MTPGGAPQISRQILPHVVLPCAPSAQSLAQLVQSRYRLARLSAYKVEHMDREGFFERVYTMVEQIPRGMVATYGQIARLIGEPRRARYVGFALHANPRPGIVPCHRVVFADGSLCEGFAFGGIDVQRNLLEEEGVRFTPAGKVDLAACRWPAGI